MSSAEAASGLPASRTDALSVVVLGLISAYLGSTPGHGKVVAVASTSLSNAWAIVSSVLTFLDMLHNPHKIETYLWLFVLGLLILTITSSGAVLIALVFKNAEALSGCAFMIGFLMMIAVFLFGLVDLLLAYINGCDSAAFAASALCKHSTGYVVGAVVGAGVLAFLGALIIVIPWNRSGSVVSSLYKMMRDVDATEEEAAHSFSGAALARLSALAKVCLLGVYWFLVDADLTWDFTVNGNNMKWWVTGQWAKQGSAIANNFFNHLC